ncbi:MAG: alpha/beta hydrolase-fold protein, partial [Prevotella sp.]|nr:alpha/beta hydrolase-fold protein [Prevotella sp.]
MRKLIYCLVLLLAPLTSMAGTLLHRTAPSALLSGMPQVDYTIYLPDSMTAGRKFPIAYLLHGGGCSNTEWQDHGHLKEVMDSLIRRGEVAPMIVVCPEANKKNMIWFNDPQWRYEDFFFTEFLPYIERTYPVIADRRYRFVGGFSM